MKIDLDVIYKNGESGETKEGSVTLDASDEKTISMVEDIKSGVTHEALESFFKHLYDNTNEDRPMDGSEVGVGYETLWDQFSQRAFDGQGKRSLGWHDVTVDVCGLRIDGKEIWDESSHDYDEVDCYEWRLQLVREEKFMYCCG